jgi:hypothetical protein
MANVQHILTGAGAPSSIPTGIGHHYIDTSVGGVYVSVGITAISDWHRSGSVISGSGVPASTPVNVGDMYIDETNDVYYIAVNTTDAAGWKSSGGGSDGPVSSDFADYTFVPDGTAQVIIIDVTKKHHRIDASQINILDGGSLIIQLPNAGDLAEVDFTGDVHFTILMYSGFAALQSGLFNVSVTSIGLQVNGAAAAWTGIGIGSDSISDTNIAQSSIPNGADTSWDFINVRSSLSFDVRLAASGVYFATATRDFEAQLGA